MDKIEHQREHFNSIATEYYAARKDTNHLQYKKRLFSFILSNFLTDTNEKKRVLEPMCGYGEGKSIIEKYLTENIQYEGFDYSAPLIDTIKKEHPDMNVWVQDVTTYSSEEKYDIIILIGGLHHVPDYAADVVKRLSKVLKSGGVFINFEPTNNNPVVSMIRNIIYKKNHLFDEKTERAFSLKILNKMFQDAGFVKQSQFYPGLLGYVMYYNPDAFPLLNRGDIKTVDRIFDFEKGFYSNWIGRTFSFCTFSIFRKI